ncbi:hypothetical protein CBM2598_U10283 [Cupriavidus taiwanensis]|nr:hypothetical protein CBM2598_U10283 [Cupriavidus taiwanensis]
MVGFRQNLVDIEYGAYLVDRWWQRHRRPSPNTGDAHTQSFCPPGEFKSDGAEADNYNMLLRKLEYPVGANRLPLPAILSTHEVRKLTREGEHHGQYVLRYVRSMITTAIGQRHIAPGLGCCRKLFHPCASDVQPSQAPSGGEKACEVVDVPMNGGSLGLFKSTWHSRLSMKDLDVRKRRLKAVKLLGRQGMNESKCFKRWHAVVDLERSVDAPHRSLPRQRSRASATATHTTAVTSASAAIRGRIEMSGGRTVRSWFGVRTRLRRRRANDAAAGTLKTRFAVTAISVASHDMESTVGCMHVVASVSDHFLNSNS